LSTYPRREASDAKMLEEEGCTLLWLPDVATMYPDGSEISVPAGSLGEGLDGTARPGHFDGVATVVSRLFDQVRPDIALFGEKDYQQLAVIRQMVRDLGLAVEIVGVPTQRDADGLALSSRNAYLSDEERQAARALPRALGEAAAAIGRGSGVAEALATATERLAKAGFDPIDYVALCDAATLVPVSAVERPARLLAAARIGRTRLIDNLAIDPPD
jgi:pantoate--beta-alanine ligase